MVSIIKILAICVKGKDNVAINKSPVQNNSMIIVQFMLYQALYDSIIFATAVIYSFCNGLNKY